MIYEVFDCRSGAPAETDKFVTLTNPASCRQIILALKNEGLIAKGCRYASFGLGDGPYTNILSVYRGDKIIFFLVPTE